MKNTGILHEHDLKVTGSDYSKFKVHCQVSIRYFIQVGVCSVPSYVGFFLIIKYKLKKAILEVRIKTNSCPDPTCLNSIYLNSLFHQLAWKHLSWLSQRCQKYNPPFGKKVQPSQRKTQFSQNIQLLCPIFQNYVQKTNKIMSKKLKQQLSSAFPPSKKKKINIRHERTMLFHHAPLSSHLTLLPSHLPPCRSSNKLCFFFLPQSFHTYSPPGRLFSLYIRLTSPSVRSQFKCHFFRDFLI